MHAPQISGPLHEIITQEILGLICLRPSPACDSHDVYDRLQEAEHIGCNSLDAPEPVNEPLEIRPGHFAEVLTDLAPFVRVNTAEAINERVDSATGSSDPGQEFRKARLRSLGECGNVLRQSLQSFIQINEPISARCPECINCLLGPRIGEQRFPESIHLEQLVANPLECPYGGPFRCLAHRLLEVVPQLAQD